MKNKAIFLDRDGVINKLVYDAELGIIHTPLRSDQIELVFGIIDFLKQARQKGYLLIVISNQPNIGIKKMSKKQFLGVKRKLHAELKKNGIKLDEEYYCFHHPFADIKAYRKVCNCRKPHTLLYNKAIKKYNIDPKESWTIGDGIFDIIAGKNIGVKTMLIANIHESSYFEILEEQLKNNLPDKVVKNLKDASIIIFKD